METAELMETGKFTVVTRNQMELINITDQVRRLVQEAGLESGTCFLFNPHTTAGLTINEGADPDVREDIITGLRQMVPINYPFKHQEGNSPAHIMASMAGSSLTILIEDGRLQLGTWQALYFCEFDGPRTRTVRYRIST